MNPEKIGRYQIMAEIGRGGMATVYRANDPRSEREVAIKVLPREMLHDPQFRTRFEREAKTIAVLEHPAIVPVYDFGEEDGQPYFVMRYMTGGSLSDRIKKGPISVPETARLMARLAPALDSAHNKGIIHRDLKPGNILFDQYGEPYVSDFGIAKLTETPGGMTGSAIVGTPAYMSPEQAQGEAVDRRSDIYGLGVILFEMLTGQQPFHGDTPMSVVVKHITDPIPNILDLKPDLPTGTDRIIEKALAKDKSERFDTCQQLTDALGSLARGETLYLGPAPTTSRMAKPTTPPSVKVDSAARTMLSKPEAGAVPQAPRKRSRAWIGILIGVFVLCALAVGGVFLFRNQIPFLASPTSTLGSLPVTPSEEVIQPADTPTEGQPPIIVDTSTPSEGPTASPEPRQRALGGTDLIAFVNARDIWVMKPDGSDLRQLTTDGAAKHSLQWSPDGKSVLYISGKCILMVDIVTSTTTNIACFNAATYLEDLSISPDGSNIAISLDRILYVVPFDLEKLGKARNHNDMKNMGGCFTYETLGAKAARWSADGNRIALEVIAPEGSHRVDRVQVFDITNCIAPTGSLATFPGPSSDLLGYSTSYSLPAYDWDGASMFLLNTLLRNDSYGYLYSYNLESHRFEPLDPIKTGCCYSDPRWSADGSHFFFAYQDLNLGSASKNLLYYIPFGTVGTGATYTPIPLPENFLANPRENPEAALRPAR